MPTTEPVIIGSVGQEEEIKATYGDRISKSIRASLTIRAFSGSQSEREFFAAAGVDLLLYVRRDVAKPAATN